jgi:hypothetical protein
MISIKEWYKYLQSHELEGKRDTQRSTYDPAITTAKKLNKQLMKIPYEKFELDENNVLHDLSFQLSIFIELAELAKKHLKGKQNTRGWADDILLNRLVRLYKDISNRKLICYKSKKTGKYQGTFVSFLNMILPYFDIDASKAQAFAKRYDKRKR